MTNDANSGNAQNGKKVSADGGATRRTVLKGAGATATGLALGSSVVGNSAARDIPLPQLKRKGNKLVDPTGEQVILRGVNIIDAHRAQRRWRFSQKWSQSAEEKANAQTLIDLATADDWANHVIRLPCQPQDISAADSPDQIPWGESFIKHDDNWGPMLPVAFTESQLETYLDKYVQPAVEKAKEAGAYIQIDYHRHFPIFHQPQYADADLGQWKCGSETIPAAEGIGMCGERGVLWHGPGQVSEIKGLEGSPEDAYYETEAEADPNNSSAANIAEALTEELEMFWTAVAQKFGGENHVLFDIFNEPTGPYAGTWGSPNNAPAGGEETGINTSVDSQTAKPYWRLFLERIAPIVKLVEEEAGGHVKTIGSPRWSQYTYWAKDMEVYDVGSTYSDLTNMCYTGHRYTHDNLQPMSKYYGEPAEEVPIMFNEWGWNVGGGSDDFEFLDGSTGEYPSDVERGEDWPPIEKKNYQEEDYEPFLDNHDVHPMAWCFDIMWAPSFFHTSDSGTQWEIKDYNTNHAQWYKEYISGKAEQDLPSECSGSSCDWGGTNGKPPWGDSTAPGTPSNLMISSSSCTSVTVEWSAPSGDVNYYMVEAAGMSKQVSGTMAELTGLQPDTDYEVSVTATGPGGNSSDAATVMASTDSSGCSVGGTPEMSLEMETSTVAEGEMAKVDLVLSNAPNGIQGFDVRVDVSDTSIATIENAMVGAGFTAQFPGVQISDDMSTVAINAADVDDSITSGASDIKLADLTFRLKSEGMTDISAGVTTVSNDNGGQIDVEAATMTLDVQGDGPGTNPVIGNQPAQNMDEDMYLEDINGDGELNFNDLVMYYQNMDGSTMQDNKQYFDYNDDDALNFNDLIALYQEMQSMM